jgi:hypothetical protein
MVLLVSFAATSFVSGLAGRHDGGGEGIVLPSPPSSPAGGPRIDISLITGTVVGRMVNPPTICAPPPERV